MKMLRLNVNIDHVATVRQARRAPEPGPVAAAVLAELAGADGITVHLRGDRRHIQDMDVRLLRQIITTHLNMEMAATDEMVAIACEIKPDVVTLVPESPSEITTEGGLDVKAYRREVSEAATSLRAAGIDVSTFVEAIPEQIRASRDAGAQQVELCTARYAHLTTACGSLKAESQPAIEAEVSTIRECARAAIQLRLRVAAGHGLTYRNVGMIAAIPEIEELNIGHNIIARALMVGLDQAVREMIAAIRRSRQQVMSEM